jgi:farnesyl-diphosphate farnesyltransferase
VRVAALEAFCELLGEAEEEAVRRRTAEWAEAVPIDHEGYQELISEVPFVLDAFFALDPRAQEELRRHTRRTARGMAEFVARTDDDGVLHLDSLRELRDYCYVVAGIVGEMLTELFLLGGPQLEPVADSLRGRSRHFGEALQLVNILKDSASDAAEGRSYLPPGVERAEVLELARGDLRESVGYIRTLRRGGADPGVVAFNAINVLLAFATVEKLEREGPGAKIGRDRVYRIVEEVEHALEHDLPLFPDLGAVPGSAEKSG